MLKLNMKKIQIGPFNFEVTRNPPITDDIQDLGGTDFEKLIISYTQDPKYSPQVISETLLHEVLHAVIFLTPYHYFFSPEEEENLIRSFSPGEGFRVYHVEDVEGI